MPSNNRNVRDVSWGGDQYCIVAADVLVLKHQAISSHNIDSIPVVSEQFQSEIYAFNMLMIKTSLWGITQALELTDSSLWN